MYIWRIPQKTHFLFKVHNCMKHQPKKINKGLYLWQKSLNWKILTICKTDLVLIIPVKFGWNPTGCFWVVCTRLVTDRWQRSDPCMSPLLWHKNWGVCSWVIRVDGFTRFTLSWGSYTAIIWDISGSIQVPACVTEGTLVIIYSSFSVPAG